MPDTKKANYTKTLSTNTSDINGFSIWKYFN